MTRLADIPVQHKLRYAMLLTSSLALLLAFAVFLTVDFSNYRRNLVQGVETLAKVTADNSPAAVAFNDAVAARDTLEALEADPQIVAAALYTSEGTILARYQSSPDMPVPPAPPGTLGVTFENETVVVVQPVEEGGRRLGLLYVRASEDLMRSRMATSAWIALGGLLISLAVAAVMATWLGRTLARPIVELDATASAVTAEQDYSRRARQYGRDELGRLTAAFNAMLESAQRSVSALRESEQRFRVLADHAPVLIWMTDPQHRFVWVNQRWIEFAGGTLEEQVRLGWAEGIHPDDRENAVRQFQAALQERRDFQLEYRRRRRDGEYRWILSQGLPRFDGGNFLGYISSGTDVSDRRQAEEAMLKARDRAVAASRAKDNFLAALSHELRTPLTPVLLLASEEANNPRHSPAVRADFEMIAKNVALEARLIDDLLDLTRITRGKLALDWAPTDANVVLNDALAAVRADFEEKRIDLQLELAAPRHRLMADPVRLQQVFWNVLKNAAKFTAAGGRVTIATSVVDRVRLLVRVTDTGIGMTPQELARVFEAFAQGDHAEEKGHRFGGLGLGLAISERLVQLHGGTIRADSPGRGLGSTFEIELPLAEVPTEAGAREFARG